MRSADSVGVRGITPTLPLNVVIERKIRVAPTVTPVEAGVQKMLKKRDSGFRRDRNQRFARENHALRESTTIASSQNVRKYKY